MVTVAASERRPSRGARAVPGFEFKIKTFEFEGKPELVVCVD